MVTQRFLGFINENQLFGPTDRVLLAVSGGLDSVVMADVFQRAGQPFAIAHVNFSLRGAESDADAYFVENMAKRYGVPFHLTCFNTAAVAAERGVSIQMAARELRYVWFAELLRDHGYAAVATAHHQNDVLETVLLNLTRGTGLAGLHGIRPRNGNVVRPLLFATRAELAEYAGQHDLTHREDSSNADDHYARNRIRHHVVPVLTDLNPGLWQTLPRTVERLRASETLLREELERSWQNVAQPYLDGFWLPTEGLLRITEPAFRLAEWLRPYGFAPDQTDAMLTALRGPVGQVFLSATYQVTHDRLPVGGSSPAVASERQLGLLLTSRTMYDYSLVLTEWPAEPLTVPGVGTLRMRVSDKPTDFRPPADPNVACLDADRLTFPLTIRPWQPGDRIRPLGMNGTKLVSDLLNDAKLTRPARARTAVLLSGERIAWVIGLRIAQAFRVTEETRRVVKVSVNL